MSDLIEEADEKRTPSEYKLKRCKFVGAATVSRDARYGLSLCGFGWKGVSSGSSDLAIERVAQIDGQ